jgi:acyl-[acyl-carrier-protein] desaturase
MIIDMERVVEQFAMPGTGISNFREHTLAIANEGIYSLAVYHDSVLAPTLRYWRIEELTGLSTEASRARDRMLQRVERLGRIARRFEEQRSEQCAARV